MDTFTFITKMTEYLAWPIAVCILTFLIKDDIGKALANIRRVKHKGMEIDFGKELKEASQVASQSSELIQNKDEDNKSNELATLSPRGAIIESWLKVEKSLQEFAKRHNINIDKQTPFRIKNILWHNLDYDVLGKGTIEMLERLRHLRNEAVHLQDSNINSEDAIEYRSLAMRVVHKIELV